jgi:FtsH-binding integral membrane protein
MRERQHMLPVWFFIGLLLTIYGVIVLIAAIVDWSQPTTAILSQYHAALWGGIVLLLIGGGYVLKFWPRQRREK